MNAGIRAYALSVTAALLLLLSGCAVHAQVKAITEAVVGYSDYYIEVRDLGAQVRGQFGQANAGGKSADYTITVDIPDYASLAPGAVSFTPPAPDFSSRSAAAYRQEAALALRQSLERYATEHGADRYVQLPVTFAVVSGGRGWMANLTSQSKLAIRQTVEQLVLTVLEEDETYRRNERLMRVSSALPALLADAFGGEAYARLIRITDVSAAGGGSYNAAFTYPDPAYVFDVLGEAYVASFHQPFYGSERAAVLSADGIRDADLTQAPMPGGRVSVSLDEETGACALLDDGGLAASVAAARAQAEAEASATVNAAWRVAPLDPPKSGKVLEGKSAGNRIEFKASASLGAYCYVRFYAISGEDVDEEGALRLGVFIAGGKSAKLRLPAGYYRVTCAVGESWYGLEHLFGSDTKTYDGANAVQSRNGYVNQISFG